jgi:Fe-S cluster assembly protein SufB
MDNVLQEKLNKKYDAGFTTNVESVTLPPGLDENTIRQI